MAKKLNSFRSYRSLEERENKFTLSSANAPIPNYDALRDSNLRQYFESRSVQKFLQSTGWIDKTGKIVDLDKFRAKLNIIEQEFKYAEKTEFWRMKEEEEMRRTIQIKRERALEEAKRQERAAKIKEENRIRRGIILAARNQAIIGSAGGGSVTHGSTPKLDLSAALQRESSLDVSQLSASSARWGERERPPAGEPQPGAGKQRGDGGGDAGGGAFFVTQQPGE